MKKILILVTLLSLITFVMSSTILIPTKKKTIQPAIGSISKSTPDKAPTCDCPQVTGVSEQVNGSFVTISWNSVSQAKSYSLGGYYTPGTPGSTFAYCVTPGSASSYTIPANSGGTARITANCDNAVCTSATCSASPSDPVSW